MSVPIIAFVFWLKCSTIFCYHIHYNRQRQQQVSSLASSADGAAGGYHRHHHSANLRALLWPIRTAAEGARIHYKIYISPNKFQIDDHSGRIKMYSGEQRPIRAMLGSQGGMGEFDTPISGRPTKLYIWVRDEQTTKTQRFVINEPNFFKNYALDFRDGEVIEYERVNGVLDKLQLKTNVPDKQQQLKTIFLEAKAFLEGNIEAKVANLRQKIFSKIDEILAENYDTFFGEIIGRKTEQKLVKLKANIIGEIQEQVREEISMFQKKKWIFTLVDA